MFRNLPCLKHMKLDHINLDDEVFPIFLDICKRLTSLETTSCIMQAPNPKIPEFECAIQRLSISKGCQMDVVGFSSQCHHLNLFIIGTDCSCFKQMDRDNEQRRMESLAIFLDSGKLRHLEHLDISLAFRHDVVLPTRIPCLRNFKAPEILPLSVPGFRIHFSMISKIDAFGPLGFWQEVLASCPSLVTAQKVDFSRDDIISGAPWVCTALEDLWLEFGAQSGILDHEAVEVALFRRISKLRKLSHLGLGSLVNRVRKSTVKGLASESWELLSKLTQLTSLELGQGHCSVLNKSTFAQISSLKGLRRLIGCWPSKPDRKKTKKLIKKLRKRGIEVHWFALKNDNEE